MINFSSNTELQGKLNKMKMILRLYASQSSGSPSPHLATIFHEDQRHLSPGSSSSRFIPVRWASGSHVPPSSSVHPSVVHQPGGHWEQGPLLGGPLCCSFRHVSSADDVMRQECTIPLWWISPAVGEGSREMDLGDHSSTSFWGVFKAAPAACGSSQARH